MSRLYSVKTASRRWPEHIIYNLVDMALTNSRVINKAVCKNNFSHRACIQKVCEELMIASGGQYRVVKYRSTFLVPLPVPSTGTPSNYRVIESFFGKHCDMFLFFVSIAASKEFLDLLCSSIITN